MSSEVWANVLFWFLVPPLLARALLSVLHALFYAPATRPRAGSPRHARHYKLAYSAIVVLYLAGSLRQVVDSLPENYYSVLNTEATADYATIKRSYRQLSLELHPDKIVGAPDYDRLHRRFLHARNAHEVLKSPLKRAAYNVFGRHAAECIHCKTYRDFFYECAVGQLGFYVTSAVLLFIFSFLGKGEFGRYWRFTAFLALFALDAHILVTRRDPLAPLLPAAYAALPFFERLQVLQQCLVYLFIALSQLGPLWAPDGGDDRGSTAELLAHVERQAQYQLREANHTLQWWFEAFRDSQGDLDLIQRLSETLIVDSRLLRSDEKLMEARRAMRATSGK